MGTSRGKQFEIKFKEDFSKIPDSNVKRLYDVTMGYKSIVNECDFICYVYPNEYWLEVKSHLGNTFPWTALRQYTSLVPLVGKKGLRVGVVLWMIDHDKVIYLPISTITKMKRDNKKSFNIKDLNNPEYRIIEIPSVKRRVFLDTDYSILLTELKEGD